MPGSLDSLPISRLFLRDLLVRCELGCGSTLIDVGCGSGELAAFCHGIGINVAGFDDDEDAVAKAQQSYPDIDFHAGVLANSIPFEARRYDVAFVRGMDVYDDDLGSIEAFASTANLLSCLKPLGKLVFLYDDALADLGDRSNERQAELADHFSNFPGRCRAEQYAEGIGRFISPSYLTGQRARRGHTLLTMQVPPKAIDRLSWHQFARDAVLESQQRAA